VNFAPHKGAAAKVCVPVLKIATFKKQISLHLKCRIDAGHPKACKYTI